jgi:hypothetical protein
MKRFTSSCFVVSTLLACPVAAQLGLPDVLLRQGLGGLPDSPEASDKFGSAFASGDFDGDGYQDLAIGVPGENSKAGAVQVIYGSADGLDTARQSLIRQSDLPGAGEGAEAGDEFGRSVATGDFDGDDIDDLAIGAPLEHVGSVLDGGAVSVIYGAAVTGLDLSSAQYWTQDSTGIQDTAENNDQFGWSLAAGDFDHDLVDDLAIGAHKEGVPGASQAGAVHVIYGIDGIGLASTGNAQFDQFAFGDSPETGESFGWSLAVGRFDGDTYDDLAIGTPAETLPPSVRGGAVTIAFGSSGGLTPTDSFTLNLFPYVEGDSFGSALAAGRFNGDTYDDLAVGVPGRDYAGPPSVADAGWVFVFYGSFSKILVGSSGDSLRQGLAGVGELPEISDAFGATLTTGRYPDGSDELDYLVIGAPSDSIDGAVQAGAVHVLYPSASGVVTADLHQLFHQNVADFGATETCEAFDRLGTAVGTGDFNGDGSPDLAIGVAEEDIGAADTGAVHVLSFPSTVQLIFESGFETNDTSEWSETCTETCG